MNKSHSNSKYRLKRFCAFKYVNMEAKAYEHVRKKEWARAAEIYNQLLLNKHLNKQLIVTYLLGRSECFLELRQHEAVVADCRRVIRLLAERKEDDNQSKARRRLVYALLALQRFAGNFYFYYIK